jgi:hypothetical protein
VRAAKDFGVFRSGPLRSAPLQNPKDSGRALASRLRFDVAAANRWFSRPHRFRVLQFDCAFAHDLIQRARIGFRLYGSLRAVNLLLVPALQIDRARSAIYVVLYIIGEMLSLQKCGADAKDPVVTQQIRERTQHLCNAWQVFRRDSTQPIASALVLRECLARRCCELFCRCGKGLPLDSNAR